MRTRVYQNKEQIFCEWRHQWVRLTPEEWVRQQLLHRLVEQFGFPASLIGVEVSIQVGETHKRCDAVVYNRALQPLMLIECKAEMVPLTQKTLDQALIYNRRLRVPQRQGDIAQLHAAAPSRYVAFLQRGEYGPHHLVLLRGIIFCRNARQGI